MKQYEKAPAPRNRNRRNGPRGSARASRNLIRHSNRAGLSWSAPRLRSTAGLCSTGICGTGPEADLPARGGRASAGLLRPAAGSLLRIRRPWLEASASVPWALRALLLSSLTTRGLGNAVWWNASANAEETWNGRARIENDPRFFFAEVSAQSQKQVAIGG